MKSSAAAKLAPRCGLVLGWAAAIPGVNPVLGIPIRPWQLLVLFAVALTLLSGVRWGRARVTGVDLAFLAWIVGALSIEFWNSGALNYSPDWFAVAGPVFFYAGYLVSSRVVSDLDDLLNFIKCFTQPVLLSAALGILQVLSVAPVNAAISAYAAGDGLTQRLADGRLIRATGLVGHWTSFGSYLVVMASATIGLIILLRQQRKAIPATVVARMVAVFVGVLSTLTFSSIIGVAILLFLGWKAMGFRLGALLTALSAVAVCMVVFGRALSERLEQQTAARSSASLPWVPEWVPNTINYRLRVWTTETIPAILERPIEGWGSGLYVKFGDPERNRVYPRGLEWPSPESQWLFLLITQGVVGLVALALLLFVSFHRLRDLSGTLSAASRLGSPLQVCLVVAVAASFTAPVLTNRGFPAAFWPLLGAALATGARLASSHRPAPQRSSRLPRGQAARR